MFGRAFRVIGAFFILVFMSSTAVAGSFSLLENTTFVREKGKPKVETISFGYQNSERFQVTVYNGGVDHQYCRVSSAVIALNGSTIFSPSDFNQQVFTITHDVDLQSNNTISVELRSNPGCGIELNVTGEVVIPDLSITSTPATQAISGQLYQYQLVTNPVLSWNDTQITFDNAPNGLTVDNGLLTWTPSSQQIGEQDFTLHVSHPEFGDAEQAIHISVVNGNKAPLVESFTIELNEDGAASFALQGTDPNSDPLNYTATSQPQHGQILVENGQATYTPTANFFGTDYFEYIANDGEFNSNVGQVTLQVSGVNDAPQIISEPLVAATQDLLYQYSIEAIDMDGDLLTFQLVTYPQGMSIDLNATVVWTPNYSQTGEHQVVLEVTDPEGASAQQSFTLTVNNVNDAPLITSSPITTVAENQQYSYHVVATDYDLNDHLTYGLTLAPVGMVIDANSGVIDWTAGASQIGSHTVTVVVHDSAGLSDSQSYSLLVTNVEDAPVIVSQPLATATERKAYSYTVIATDADIGDVLDFSLISSPTGMTIDSLSGIIRWLPDATQTGDYPVSILVTDKSGLTDSQSYVLNVINVNDAPEITSTPVTHAQALVEYSYQLSVTDLDNDPIIFSLATAPLGMSISQTGLVSWTPTRDQVGDHQVSIVVSDPQGASNIQDYVVLVEKAANTAPTANDLQVSGNEDSPIVVQLTAQDVDADNLTYEIVTQPANGVLSGTAPDLVYTPATNFYGSDSFTFKTNDGVVESNLATVVITVVPMNDAPFANAQSLTMDEDSTLSILLSGSDVDGDSLSFSVATSPLNGQLTGTAPNLIYTPNANFYGADSFTFKSNDGAADSFESTVNIQVASVNDAPVIFSSPVVDGVENSKYNYAVTASDVEQEAMKFFLILAPAGMTIDEYSGLVEWSPLFSDIGEHEITIQVVDSSDGKTTQSYHLLIAPEPVLDPEITSNPVTVGFLNTRYQYLIEVTDPKDLALTYELMAAPQGMTINSVSGEVTWVPAEEGTFDVQLKVINSKGGFAIQSYSIAVVDSQPSHEGDDFWVVFGWNHTGTGLVHNLYISAVQETSGLVESEGLNLSIPFNVVPGQVTVVELPKEVEHLKYGVESKGIHITSENKVSVYGLNNLTSSTDGFLALPTRTLGKYYMAMEYPKHGLLYALATEDNTEITFRVPIDLIVNGKQMSAGDETLITLQKGQSYLFYQGEDSIGKMLTGSTLSSTKPFAAFSGNECSYVPETFGACDHLYEQLPAIEHWGNDYVSISLAERFKGDTFRILAAKDNTQIRINGNIITTLNSGQVMENIFDGPTTFSADKPILVAQFSNGLGYDQAETGNTKHDPFMLYLPAQAQYLKRYTFATPGEQIQANYINIVIPANGLSSLTLDGNPVDANLFTEIQSTGLFGAQISVAIGTHTVQSDVPFGLTVYGYDDADSYGYSGGMLLATLSSNNISLKAVDTQPTIGDSVCVTASVTHNGLPAVATRVDFSVEGNNNHYDFVFTSDQGEAEFCYRSAVIGTDVIKASVGDDNSIISMDWQWSANGDGQQAPKIVSTPVADAFVGGDYQYQIIALDPDTNSSLTYSLPVHPEGMNIDENGLISWLPGEEQRGVQSVNVVVTDNTGLVDEQAYQLFVSQLNRNPEIINPPPLFKAYINRSNFINIEAIDPDGNAISYEVIEGPSKFNITKYQGRISYYPWASDIGEYISNIRVKDSVGGETILELPVSVVENHLPQVTAGPATQAKVGQTYSSVISVNDPDDDVVKFYRQYGPKGLTVDTDTGKINFLPTINEIGKQNVSVLISDGLENILYNFELLVADANEPFVANITATPLNLDLNQSTTIQASSTGASGPVSYTLTVDGVVLPLDQNGQASFSNTDHLGNYQMHLVADDGVNIATSDEHFSVSDPDDTSAPVVSLDNLVSGQKITSITEVMATVNDSNLSDWTLYFSEIGSDLTEFTILAQGRNNIEQSVIASFDPTVLQNGQYAIVLDAVTLNGLKSQANAVVVVDGDLKVGNFSITFEDKNIPLAGIPIRVTRTYDSRQKSKDLDFGFGWSVGYQDVKLQEMIEPTKGWYQESSHSFFKIDSEIVNLPSTCTVSQNGKLVTVTLPNGNVEEFNVRARPVSGGEVSVSDPDCTLLGGRYVGLVFEPKDGTDSELVSLDGGNLYLSNQAGGNLTLDVIETEAVDVHSYQLTTRTGFVYKLDQYFGIETITDPNGNTLTYSDNGIVHSSGIGIDFTRDSAGRIIKITDPQGNEINYSYNASGDLSDVTNAASAVTSFNYNSSHGLLDIIDPLGRNIVKNIYDDSNRLIAQEDSNGNRTDFNHDLAGRQSVVTDRLGHITTLYYDEEGNVTSQVDALGHVTSFMYDANGNQLSKTDALIRTTSATYNDKDDQLTQMDALGNTVNFEYNERGQELTITDEKGNHFTNAYDAVGNLLSITDPLNNAVSNVVNSRGLPDAVTDALGNTTSYTYDYKGNKLTETDPLGVTTQYTYDANNNVLNEIRSRTLSGNNLVEETSRFEYDALDRVITTTDALGQVSTVEYDLVGNQVATIDPLNRRTEMDYDAYGRLVETRYPDGSKENKSYDVEGNLLTDTDRLGNVTHYEYDALNRLIKTTFADNSFTQTEYDAVGQVTAEIDAKGNRTEYEYDLAGRRIKTTDALGNVHQFAYDEGGNLVNETDALGHTTTYIYDKLDRKTQTIFANTSSVFDGFDALARKTSATDQAGIVTNYAYDASGRLTSVTDVEGNVTAYTYDEAGNKLTQTDAEGRTTAWAYDALGRVLTRTLPLGQVESFTYNAVGNLLTRTDFNGDLVSYSYDDSNRVTSINYAKDGSTESFTYDLNGNRLTSSNAQGTWIYAYDAMNRLASETQPNGDVLEYSYDANGNKIELKVTYANGNVRIENSTYDVLNRLSTVTDADGNVTRYGYDAVGNRISVTHSNANLTSYVYDELNRLTELQEKHADDSVYQQFDYTLDATGRRTKIEELSGRVSDYTYDSHYRLTDEVISDAVNGNYTASYTFDKVGNRIGSTINGVSTVYTYDANDRLVQQGGEVYSYDDNGSTLSKTIDSDITTYAYDARQKLIAASVLVGGELKESSYAYNVDGIRTRKVDSGVVTNYLVDSNRDYAQVIAEIDSSNGINVEYVFGDDLLSQTRTPSTLQGEGRGEGELSIYQYDGLGSTRALTDSTGNISDEYFYDAFGVELARTGPTENDYLFTGEQFDRGLNNYYLRARYYDQGVGRFTQQDTWMGNNSDPITLHKYLYANASPTVYTDLTGNFSGGLAGQSTANAVLGLLVVMHIAKVTLFESNVIDKPVEELTDTDTGILMMGDSGRKLENLLSTKQDRQKREYVAKPAELIHGHIVVMNKKLTFAEALTIVRIGDDVIAIDRSMAEKIATVASGMQKPIGPERHLPNNPVFKWAAEPVVYRWHYHTRPRNDAHIFY